jgi:hypothetical protein
VHAEFVGEHAETRREQDFGRRLHHLSALCQGIVAAVVEEQMRLNLHGTALFY